MLTPRQGTQSQQGTSRREIWIPVFVLATGGLLSYGSLKSDVEHKAEDTDVAVIQAQLTNIAGDVSENKTAIQTLDDKITDQTILLNNIASRLGVGAD